MLSLQWDMPNQLLLLALHMGLSGGDTASAAALQVLLHTHSAVAS